jgi:peptidoglycan/LPS O-acetylase OafA/YrhL
LYKGIEGLRAYLAWTVVLAHLGEYCGATERLPKGGLIGDAGNYAVLLFIVISGFVITHLILSKKEPFPIYMARRALRLYPAYLVALALSILTAPIAFHAVSSFAYSPEDVLRFIRIEQEQFTANFTPHLLAHLSLLHGAIPNQLLPYSQYEFLGPAWSLSLEWQFYLVAPLWIWLLYRKPVIGIALALIAALTYKEFLWRGFINPSFLPGAILWFLLGIATRAMLPYAPKLSAYPWAIVLGCFALVLLDKQLVVLWLWIAMVAYILQPKAWSVLDGKLAQSAGSRSYCVYILHEPILGVALFAAARWFSGPMQIVGFFALTIAATIAVSEIIHRWVEVPAIRIGRGLQSYAAQPA